jgi:hypothetical protein
MEKIISLNVGQQNRECSLKETKDSQRIPKIHAIGISEENEKGNES